MPMPQIITLPTQARPLPGPTDLARLMQCRYVVLVVCGRSGSSLYHSHLDGHRQVAHIPAVCKFHDVFTVHRGLLDRDPMELARGFAEYPPNDYLFDTQRNAIVGGQLGQDGSVIVRIDRASFQRAMAAALGGPAVDPRRALYAAVLAYEWCLGRDLGDARILLHHLHHGDWLWPDLLADPFNLAGLTPRTDLRAALKPDLLLIPVRSPMDVIRSYPAVTVGLTGAGTEQVSFYERLMRLLPQDWLRVRVAAASDIPTLGIKLEEFHADRPGMLKALCNALGIDPADPALGATTHYGHVWTEDSWRVAGRRAVAADPGLDREPCWQDKAFILGAMSGLANDLYPEDAAYADRDHVTSLLLKAADEDPPETLYPGLKPTLAGRAAAADAAWNRLGFVNQFWSVLDSQRLGTLRLCRP